MKKIIAEDADKVLYETDNEEEILCKFTEDVVDSRGHVKGTVKNKASINGAIAAHIFKLLAGYHVPTCLKNQKSAKELLLKKAEVIPVLISVTNETTDDGITTPEFRYDLLTNGSKKIITAEEIVASEIMIQEEFADMRRLALKINVVLDNFFRRRKFELLGFSVQFGYINGKIAVCSPFSLDSFELKDTESRTKFKTSFFLSHIDNAVELYDQIYNQIMF
ncbi:hypothetical protein JXA70_01130 [candidate division KSB1 bacterium]|nr:hypothetical protein [candidate division KSB1 bacterium]